MSREEAAVCCQTRGEVDGRIKEEGEEAEETEEIEEAEEAEETGEEGEKENHQVLPAGNSKQDFMRIIGLQSPFRLQHKLSSTALEEENKSDGGQEDESSSMASGEECAAEMLTVGGIIYHIEEINTAIINTMTTEEKRVYNMLLLDYNACS